MNSDNQGDVKMVNDISEVPSEQRKSSTAFAERMQRDKLKRDS
jgi:hypothetical protein